MEIAASSAKMGLSKAFAGMKGAGSTALGMATDAKVTTTYMEALGVQYTKTASMGLVGLGLTGDAWKKARKEIGKASYDMNTDAGGVTNAWAAMHQAGVSMEQLGFKNFTEGAKILEVTGSSANLFASAMGRMKTEGFDAKDSGKLIQQTLLIGNSFRLGRGGIDLFAKGMHSVIDANRKLNPKLRKTSAEMGAYAQGLVIVAGGIREATNVSADAAIASAEKMGQAMLAGRQNFSKVFKGLENDFTATNLKLFEQVGGVDGAFDLLAESPDKFIEAMGETYAAVEAKGGIGDLDRFKDQMADSFGGDTLGLIENYAAASKKMKAAANPKGLAGGEKIFEKTAKAQKDGRTAAERFALMQDQITTRLKKLKGVMGDTKFLNNYRDAGNEALGMMKDWANKGGPVGKATSMLINFKIHGVGGTLGAMHPLGNMFVTLAQQFAPVITALPGMAAGFAMLANPITLLVAAIAGLFFIFRDLEKGENSIVRPILDDIEKRGPELVARFVDTMKTAFQSAGEAIGGVLSTIPWDKVAKSLAAGAEKAVSWAWRMTLKGIDLTLDLINWILTVNWGAIGSVLGKGLYAAVSGAIEAAAKIIWRLPEILENAVRAAFDLIIGIVGGLEEAVKKEFPKSAEAITTVFAGVKAIIEPLFIAMIAWVVGWAAVSIAQYIKVQYQAVKSAVVSGFAWIKNSRKALNAAVANAKVHIWYYGAMAKEAIVKAAVAGWAWAKVKAKAVKDAVVFAAGWIYGYVQTAAKAVWSAAVSTKSWIATKVTMIAGAVKAAAAWVAGYMKIAATAVWSGVRSMVAFVPTIAGHIAGALSVLAGWLAAFAGMVVGAVAAAIPILIAFAPVIAIGAAIAAGVYLIIDNWDTLVGFFTKVAKGVFFWLTWPFQLAWKGIVLIKDLIVGAFDKLPGGFKKAGKKILSAVTWPFRKLWDFVVWVKNKVVGLFKGLAGLLKSAGGAIYDAVTWPFRKMGEFVSETVDSVTGFLGDAWDVASGLGGDLVDMFTGSEAEVKKSSKAMIGDLKKAAEEAAKGPIEMARGAEAAAKEAEIAGLKTGRLVRTSKGEVIAAADAAVRYVQQANGEVTKIVAKASELKFGNVTGAAEEIDKAMKLYEGYRKKMDALKAPGGEGVSSDKGRAAMDELTAGLGDFYKQYGLSARTIDMIGRQAQAAISVTGEDMKALAAVSAGAAKVMQEELARSTREHAVSLLNLEKDKGKITAEAYAGRRKALAEESGLANMVLNEQVAVLRGKWSQAFVDSAQLAGGQMGFIARMAKTTSDEFLRSSQKITREMGAGREYAEKMFSDMAKAQKGELAKIAQMEKLTVEQAKAKADEIVERYKKMSDEIVLAQGANTVSLRAGVEDGFRLSLVATRSHLDTLLKETATATDKAAAQIERTVGVSSDTAAGMVETIAGIKPKVFKKNLEAVGTLMKAFLKNFVTGMTTTMNKLVVEINKVWDQLKLGWEAQDTFLIAFGDQVERTMDRVISKAIGSYARWVIELMSLLVRATKLVRVKFEGLDIMNLLISSRSINGWANRVVLALSKNFADQGVAERAIRATEESFNRMVAGADARSSGPAAPGEGVPSSRINAGARDKIMEAIKNPSWTDKHFRNQEAQSEALVAMAEALGAKMSVSHELKSRGEDVGDGPDL